MYQQKTRENDDSVLAFIEQVEKPTKRADAYKLLEIFAETTGYQAKMWGKSIVGFGAYHYKYESGHEGDAPLVGFSPRKQTFTVYVATGDIKREDLLQKLGKYKMGKGCIYINKVDDIDVEVLKALLRQSVRFLQETYPS
ncbi:MAG: DUF1801 domain-containing protein [Firmicutes bacterium]|nr:DUF1801 domain-containing protein [Bacillota bacterium]